MVKMVTVIPTYNRKAYLRQVLSNLVVQQFRDLVIDNQIIVVVDGSTDGTLEMLHSDFPNVVVVTGTGDWWYTKSMNKGFEKALKYSPELILALNDDVNLQPDYIESIVSEYKSLDSDCIIGSVSISHSRPERITFGGVKKIVWWRYKQQNYILSNKKPETLTSMPMRPSVVLPGRGMLITARVLIQLGLFDEQLPQYGPDDDFCLRASWYGIPVYISYKARVYSYDGLTAIGNPARKVNILKFAKSFFNRYSPRYVPKTYKMIIRHGRRFLFPVTLLIVIIGSFKAYFKHRI